MKRTEIVLEFMKVVAPVFAQQGTTTIERIVSAGSNPDKCTVDGMDILHAYAKSAREWAEAFADEYEKD